MIVTSHPQNTLAGQVALVTGGVRRIGRAIALTLAGEGAAIAINAKSSRDEAEATMQEIAALTVPAAVFMGGRDRRGRRHPHGGGDRRHARAGGYPHQ